MILIHPPLHPLRTQTHTRGIAPPRIPCLSFDAWLGHPFEAVAASESAAVLDQTPLIFTREAVALKRRRRKRKSRVSISGSLHIRAAGPDQKAKASSRRLDTPRSALSCVLHSPAYCCSSAPYLMDRAWSTGLCTERLHRSS